MKYVFIGLVYALGILLGLSLFMIGLSELISGDHPEGLIGHYMFVVSGMSIFGLCVIGLATTGSYVESTTVTNRSDEK